MEADSRDVSQIQDEDLLRRMWQQTEDFGRKKEIRSHMYKLREARLKEFYTTGEVLRDVQRSNSSPGLREQNSKNQWKTEPTHADSLVDHSFLSLKSKEIRDSESPTRDAYHISGNRCDNGNWTVMTSEKSDDGKFISTSKVDKSQGSHVIDGGIVNYSRINESKSTVYNDGDDQNFSSSIEKSQRHVSHDVANMDNNYVIQTKTTSSSSHRSGGVESFDDYKIDNMSGRMIKNDYSELPPEFNSDNGTVTRETQVFPDGSTLTTIRYESKNGNQVSNKYYKEERSGRTEYFQTDDYDNEALIALERDDIKNAKNTKSDIIIMDNKKYIDTIDNRVQKVDVIDKSNTTTTSENLRESTYKVTKQDNQQSTKVRQEQTVEPSESYYTKITTSVPKDDVTTVNDIVTITEYKTLPSEIEVHESYSDKDNYSYKKSYATSGQYSTTYREEFTNKKIHVENSPTHNAFASSLRAVTPERETDYTRTKSPRKNSGPINKTRISPEKTLKQDDRRYGSPTPERDISTGRSAGVNVDIIRNVQGGTPDGKSHKKHPSLSKESSPERKASRPSTVTTTRTTTSYTYSTDAHDTDIRPTEKHVSATRKSPVRNLNKSYDFIDNERSELIRQRQSPENNTSNKRRTPSPTKTPENSAPTKQRTPSPTKSLDSNTLNKQRVSSPTKTPESKSMLEPTVKTRTPSPSKIEKLQTSNKSSTDEDINITREKNYQTSSFTSSTVSRQAYVDSIRRNSVQKSTSSKETSPVKETSKTTIDTDGLNEIPRDVSPTKEKITYDQNTIKITKKANEKIISTTNKNEVDMKNKNSYSRETSPTKTVDDMEIRKVKTQRESPTKNSSKKEIQSKPEKPSKTVEECYISNTEETYITDKKSDRRSRDSSPTSNASDIEYISTKKQIITDLDADFVIDNSISTAKIEDTISKEPEIEPVVEVKQLPKKSSMKQINTSTIDKKETKISQIESQIETVPISSETKKPLKEKPVFRRSETYKERCRKILGMPDPSQPKSKEEPIMSTTNYSDLYAGKEPVEEPPILKKRISLLGPSDKEEPKKDTPKLNKKPSDLDIPTYRKPGNIHPSKSPKTSPTKEKKPIIDEQVEITSIKLVKSVTEATKINEKKSPEQEKTVPVKKNSITRKNSVKTNTKTEDFINTEKMEVTKQTNATDEIIVTAQIDQQNVRSIIDEKVVKTSRIPKTINTVTVTKDTVLIDTTEIEQPVCKKTELTTDETKITEVDKKDKLSETKKPTENITTKITETTMVTQITDIDEYPTDKEIKVLDKPLEIKKPKDTYDQKEPKLVTKITKTAAFEKDVTPTLTKSILRHTSPIKDVPVDHKSPEKSLQPKKTCGPKTEETETSEIHSVVTTLVNKEDTLINLNDDFIIIETPTKTSNTEIHDTSIVTEKTKTDKTIPTEESKKLVENKKPREPSSTKTLTNETLKAYKIATPTETVVNDKCTPIKKNDKPDDKKPIRETSPVKRPLKESETLTETILIGKPNKSVDKKPPSREISAVKKTTTEIPDEKTLSQKTPVQYSLEEISQTFKSDSTIKTDVNKTTSVDKFVQLTEKRPCSTDILPTKDQVTETFETVTETKHNDKSPPTVEQKPFVRGTSPVKKLIKETSVTKTISDTTPKDKSEKTIETKKPCLRETSPCKKMIKENIIQETAVLQPKPKEKSPEKSVSRDSSPNKVFETKKTQREASPIKKSSKETTTVTVTRTDSETKIKTCNSKVPEVKQPNSRESSPVNKHMKTVEIKRKSVDKTNALPENKKPVSREPYSLKKPIDSIKTTVVRTTTQAVEDICVKPTNKAETSIHKTIIIRDIDNDIEELETIKNHDRKHPGQIPRVETAEVIEISDESDTEMNYEETTEELIENINQQKRASVQTIEEFELMTNSTEKNRKPLDKGTPRKTSTKSYDFINNEKTEIIKQRQEKTKPVNDIKKKLISKPLGEITIEISDIDVEEKSDKQPESKIRPTQKSPESVSKTIHRTTIVADISPERKPIKKTTDRKTVEETRKVTVEKRIKTEPDRKNIETKPAQRTSTNSPTTKKTIHKTTLIADIHVPQNASTQRKPLKKVTEKITETRHVTTNKYKIEPTRQIKSPTKRIPVCHDPCCHSDTENFEDDLITIKKLEKNKRITETIVKSPQRIPVKNTIKKTVHKTTLIADIDVPEEVKPKPIRRPVDKTSETRHVTTTKTTSNLKTTKFDESYASDTEEVTKKTNGTIPSKINGNIEIVLQFSDAENIDETNFTTKVQPNSFDKPRERGQTPEINVYPGQNVEIEIKKQFDSESEIIDEPVAPTTKREYTPMKKNLIEKEKDITIHSEISTDGTLRRVKKIDTDRKTTDKTVKKVTSQTIHLKKDEESNIKQDRLRHTHIMQSTNGTRICRPECTKQTKRIEQVIQLNVKKSPSKEKLVSKRLTPVSFDQSSRKSPNTIATLSADKKLIPSIPSKINRKKETTPIEHAKKHVVTKTISLTKEKEAPKPKQDSKLIKTIDKNQIKQKDTIITKKSTEEIEKVIENLDEIVNSIPIQPEDTKQLSEICQSEAEKLPSSTEKTSKNIPKICVTTKTVEMSTEQHVVVDLLRSKSSRESSPEKIWPVPVSSEEETDYPRYPDQIYEPDDSPRRKQPKKKIQDIPLDENEVIAEFNKITEIDTEDIHDESLLSVTEKVSRFMNTVDKVSEQKPKAPAQKVSRPEFEVTEDLKEDECLLSVSEKVSKFLNTSDSVIKPSSRQTSPERKLKYTGVKDETLKTDECMLSVSEKVSKFLGPQKDTKRESPERKPKIVSEETFDIDENLETNVCKFSSTQIVKENDRPSSLRRMSPERKTKVISQDTFDVEEKTSIFDSVVTDKAPKVKESPVRQISPERKPTLTTEETITSEIQTDESTLTVSEKVSKFLSSEKIPKIRDAYEKITSIRKSPEKKISDTLTGFRTSPERNTDDSVGKFITTEKVTNSRENSLGKDIPETVKETEPKQETPKNDKQEPELKPLASEIQEPKKIKQDNVSRKAQQYLSTIESSPKSDALDKKNIVLKSSEAVRRAKVMFENASHTQNRQIDILSRPSVWEGRKLAQKSPLKKTEAVETEHEPLKPKEPEIKQIARKTSDLNNSKIDNKDYSLKSARLLLDGNVERKMSPEKEIPKPDTFVKMSPEIEPTSICRHKSPEKEIIKIQPNTENETPEYTKPVMKHEEVTRTTVRTERARKSIEKDFLKTITSSKDEPETRVKISPKKEPDTYSKTRKSASPERKIIRDAKSSSPERRVTHEAKTKQETTDKSMPGYMRPLQKHDNIKTEETVTGVSTVIKTRRDSVEKTTPGYMKPLQKQKSVENDRTKLEEDDEGSRAGKKFGVTLRRTDSGRTVIVNSTSSTHSERRRSSTLSNNGQPNIEEIEDLNVLEEMMEKAVGYEQRRRIRSQIRNVRRVVETKQTTSPEKRSGNKLSSPNKETNYSTFTKKTTTQYTKTQEPEEIVTVTKTANNRENKATSDTNCQVNYEEQIESETKVTKRSERIEQTTKVVSDGDKFLTFKKTSPTFKRGEVTISKQTNEDCKPTDVITSSYGIGPTDENGLPLFGIKALRKAGREQVHVSGTVISSQLYSESGKEPVGQVSVTKYSTDPQDLGLEYDNTIKTKGCVAVTTTQKFGSTGTPTFKEITDKNKSSNELKSKQEETRKTITSKVTRRGSVKALSQKFIDNAVETAKNERQTYPKAGLILRTGSFGDSHETTNVEQEFVQEYFEKDSEHNDEFRSKQKGLISPLESPDGPSSASLVMRVQKSTTKETGQPTIVTTKTFESPGVYQETREVLDEQTLRSQLEQCTDYEERRLIREKLRQVMAEQEECANVVSRTTCSEKELEDDKTSVQERVETTEKIITDGPNKTIKVSTTQVTSSMKSNKPMSPFAKFRQLDKQNSLNTPPSSPSTPGGGGSRGPLFKFTDPGLNQSALTVKDRLLQWCQLKTKEYQNIKLDNFSTSWADGMAFCALIHHFLPDAFDYNALTPQQRRHNFTLAFKVADEQAGIAPLLDVDDMVAMRRPDWKCVFTYVQSIYRRFKDED